MSHELRTPLTGILGFAEVLAEEVGPDQQPWVDAILRGGRRLQDTLRSVLDLAQLEGGAVQLDTGSVDVAAEAAEVCALLGPLAYEKGIALAFDPAGASAGLPPTAVADRAALHRVLVNLVGNAVKFTETGQVAIDVQPAHTLEGHDIVRVRVRDTGVGIDPAFVPHLFEEFKQASEGYGRTHEGNGLGLAITKRLVALMGGRIEVESELGAGTTFTVDLPAVTRLPRRGLRRHARGRDMGPKGRRACRLQSASGPDGARPHGQSCSRRWPFVLERRDTELVFSSTPARARSRRCPSRKIGTLPTGLVGASGPPPPYGTRPTLSALHGPMPVCRHLFRGPSGQKRTARTRARGGPARR